MKYLFTFFCLVAALSLSAQDTETRSLRSFDEISVAQGIDLIAEKGSENSISLEVSRIDLEDVITEVRGDKLYVKLSRGNHRSNRVRAKLTYTDEIEEIHVSTGAEADFRSEIKVTDLKVTTSTSGTVYLKTTAKSVDLGATTSGRIRIQGTTEEIEVSASTGGSIDAMDLTANDAYARANTGGDIRLNAEERLRASAGTGGSVRYSGKPRTDVRTNTGGSVRRGG